MRDCIVFTGGGTGGHIFPALAVLDELKQKKIGRIIWIGSRSGMEAEIIKARGIPFYGIPCGKLRRYISVKNILDIFKILAGLIVSLIILLKEKPRFLFSKGGYVSVPPVIIAYFLRIPVITHESDLNPGLATKINSFFAEKILISFSETEKYINIHRRSKVLYTGNPIRKEMLKGDPEYGRKIAGCPSELPLLLVLGGSQGSMYLNKVILSIIEDITRSCFVVHQTGRLNSTGCACANYYAASFFSEELPHLLFAASLVICRAGANTLWEVAAAGKPSILIPLSMAASRGDQIENALYFSSRNAALIIEEQELTGGILLDAVLNFLENKSKLMQMGQAAHALSFPESASRIANLIIDMEPGEDRGA